MIFINGKTLTTAYLGVLFRCSDVIMDSFVTCSTTRTKTIDPDRPQSKIISDTLPSTKLRNRTDPYKRNNDNAVSNIDSNNHNHTQSVAKPQSTSTSSKSIIISVSRLDKTTYPRSTSSPAPAAQYLLLTDTVTMRVNFTGSAHGLDYMAEKLNQQISNTSAAAAAETSALLPTLDDVTVEWVNQVLLVDDGKYSRKTLALIDLLSQT